MAEQRGARVRSGQVAAPEHKTDGEFTQASGDEPPGNSLPSLPAAAPEHKEYREIVLNNAVVAPKKKAEGGR